MEKNKIYLVLLLLVYSNLSYSQLGGKNNYEVFMSRELLIVTEPGNELTQKLKDNPELYEEFSKNEEWLKEAMDEYWTVNKPIYLSRDEAKKITAKEKDKYVVMQIQMFTQEYTDNYVGLKDTYPCLSFDFPKIGSTRLYGYLPDGYISKARYFAGVRFLNDNFNNKISVTTQKDKEAVKKGTLLLNKLFLSQKLSLELINNYYPYNVKLVDQKEIDKAILNKENIFYIFKHSISGRGNNLKIHMIINAKTGKMHSATLLQEGLEINKKVLIKYFKILN